MTYPECHTLYIASCPTLNVLLRISYFVYSKVSYSKYPTLYKCALLHIGTIRSLSLYKKPYSSQCRGNLLKVYVEGAKKQDCKYTENALWYRCFSSNLAKIYRTAILMNFFSCMWSDGLTMQSLTCIQILFQ